ncbi:MAG: putative Ig domain-containing protein [Planctomycetes bacterium]|nr:putative Ig domain-containing protein [Planctomycetota bacterium]
MQIRLYTTSIASGTPTLASLTPIGATTNVLTPGNALWNTTVQTIPLSLPVNVTIGQRVVVEVFTPNNTAVGGSFYIGSNQAGELAPGYLVAAGCGIPDLSIITTIAQGVTGFPMHIILDLVTVPSGTAPNPEIDVQKVGFGPTGSIASGSINVSAGCFTPGGSGNVTFSVANLGQSTALNITSVNTSAAVNCTPGSPTLSASIAAGTTVTLTIPITVATGSGSFSFTVTINNNDANEGTYTIGCVGGRGLTGTVTVAPSGGTYTDIGQAFDDMENFGVGGNLVIEIAAGTYTSLGTWELGSDRSTLGAVDDVMVSNVANTVTIRAATGATVNLQGAATQLMFDGIIGAESGVMSIVGVSNLTIERLNFAGSAGAQGFGLLVSSDSYSAAKASTVTVRQCTFTGVANGAGLWAVGNGFRYDGITIENCTIRNCGGGNTPIYGTNFMPGALALFYPGGGPTGTSPAIIQHCTVTNNAGLVTTGQQGNPGAVGWRGPKGTTVPPSLNFNIFTSSTSGFPIYHFTGTTTAAPTVPEFPTVADRNVYFLSNGAVFAVESAATPVVRADFTAWRTQYGAIDAASVSADPLFVSATDLHINAGSPALELATTSTVNVDIDGDTRPNGAQRDAGSDERTGAATPLLTVSTNSVTVPTSTAGTAGTATSFTVSGSNLTPASGSVTLTLTTGSADIEFRNATAAGTFGTGVVTINYTGGAFAAQTIEVRFRAVATAGAKTGSITIAGGGAANQVVNLSGTVNATGTPTLTASTTSVTVPATTAGTAGTAASFTISGSNLTPAAGNVTLTLTTGAPDIQFRNATAGGTFGTGVVTIAYTGSAFAAQTIEVRFAAAATAGAKTGSITISGGGATNVVVNLSGTVNTAGSLTIVTTTLPNGVIGTAYNGTITAQNGTGPYTWSLASGTLPTGLTLNTAATGLTTSITGTPTAAGVFTFTVQVADSAAATDTQLFNVTVTSSSGGGTIGGGGGGGGGCSADANNAPWFALAALAGILLVAVRRRRTA